MGDEQPEERTGDWEGQGGQQPNYAPQMYGYIDPSWQNYQMMAYDHHYYGGYPHPINQGGMDFPLPPGLPGLGGSTDPLESALGPFPCAKLGNLPSDASVEDILVLFQGLVVIDVLQVGAGDAFVVFANSMDFQMAVQRDGQTIRRNFIDVKTATRSDYYAAIANQQWQDKGRPSSRGDDIGASSGGYSGGGGRFSNLNDDGPRGLGMAFGGGSSLSRAAGGYGRGPPNLGGPKRSGGGIQEGEHTGFLRMRGLPFSATKDDIFRFFESFNPIFESIVLTYRSDGRATGEAYIAFDSPEDSRAAMSLHRKSMGSRYIELFLSNKEEQGRALARFGNR